MNDLKRRLLVFPFLQLSSCTNEPLVTDLVHETPPKRSRSGKSKRLRRVVDSDDSESDCVEVGSVDKPCLMMVRLLLS